MDEYTRTNLTTQLVNRLTILNVDISNNNCNNIDEKEKEIKLLNQLYESLRKVTKYYKNNNNNK